MKNFNILFIFCVLACLTSCHKDIIDRETDVTLNIPDPPVIVDATKHSLLGRVIDEQGNPVQNATVFCYKVKTTTDIHGVFHFEDVLMDAFSTMIVVQKSGYFLASHRFTPATGKYAFAEIGLIKKNKSASFLSEKGSTFKVGNAELSFAGSSIQDENGLLYNGEVYVYAHYLDPTIEKMDEFMPGALLAKTENEGIINIASYGMILCELEDANGKPLNILAGKTASFQLPIPASIQTNSPSVIPLWYFDQSKGYWIKEGEAKQHQGVYKAEVKHFTWWNCDIPLDKPICLKGRILYDDGTPASNVFIDFTIDNVPGHIGGRPESDGSFETKVPENFMLNMTLSSSQCYGQYYSKSVIGPFTQNTMLQDIIIKKDKATLICGNVTDCNAQAISSGYVIVSGEKNRTNFANLNSDGSFCVDFSCFSGDSVSLKAFSNATSEYSVEYKVKYESNINYNLVLCNNCNFSITLEEIQVLDCSTNQGKIQAKINGGSGQFTYKWNDGTNQNKSIADFSKPYQLCVTVTDQKDGCEKNKCIITEAKWMEVDSILVTPNTCNNSVGQIKFILRNATMPVRVKTTNTQGNVVFDGVYQGSIPNLATGRYNSTITDAKNCIRVVSAFVQDDCPCNIILNLESNLQFCGPSEIEIEANNGRPPYKYQWSNGTIGDNIGIVQSGQYCVTVTDNNNCSTKACTFVTIDNFFGDTSKTISCIKKGFEITYKNPSSEYVYSYYNRVLTSQYSPKFKTWEIIDGGKYVGVIATHVLNGCEHYIDEIQFCLYNSKEIKFTPNPTSCSSCEDGFINMSRISISPCDQSSNNYQWEIYKKGEDIELSAKNNNKQLPKGVYEVYYINGNGCYLYGELVEIK